MSAADAATAMDEPLYASLEQRAQALRLGMWIFLGSETLLFAGLFGLYTAYRGVYPAGFRAAVDHNLQWVGSVNTLVLITSSFFVAWAVRCVRADRRRAAALSLVAVIGLGLTFLGLKVYEYGVHLHDGIAPGTHYAYAALPTAAGALFFSLYYAMTGLHALHVTAGLVVITWLLAQVARGRIDAERHVALELGGLYWHLVDIVWIFLWPLLYLTG